VGRYRVNPQPTRAGESSGVGVLALDGDLYSPKRLIQD